MALNVPGVMAVLIFYVLILATGIWAARKSRNAGGHAEAVLLGDRSISLLVGIFTMSGRWKERESVHVKVRARRGGPP